MGRHRRRTATDSRSSGVYLIAGALAALRADGTVGMRSDIKLTSSLPSEGNFTRLNDFGAIVLLLVVVSMPDVSRVGIET